MRSIFAFATETINFLLLELQGHHNVEVTSNHGELSSLMFWINIF